MKNSKKKYSIKVPRNIKILYCDKKNLITFIGPLATKSLKLKIKLLLISSANLIIATSSPVDEKLIRSFKNSKTIQGTTIAKIKQILTEVTYVLSRKLNLVGVGYRAFAHDKLSNANGEEEKKFLESKIVDFKTYCAYYLVHSISLAKSITSLEDDITTFDI